MATLAQFGIPGSGAGILHPKLQNRFQVRFINIAAGQAPNGGRDLTAQCISFTRPQIEWDEVQLDRYNSRSWIAGKHNWSSTQLTIEDDITGLASAVIQSQMEVQQRIIGGAANGQWLNAAPTASDYKFGTMVEMLDGNESVVETWKLEGCWFQSIDYGSLDYSASDKIDIQITMRFDHASQTLSGQGYGTALGGNL